MMPKDDDVVCRMRHQDRHIILTVHIYMENPIMAVVSQDDIHIIVLKF